jgi:transcriptional regulator with XRE-family HTH domain
MTSFFARGKAEKRKQMELLIDQFVVRRREMRLTLTELAFRTGLTHGALSRIETKKAQLTLFATVRLIRALDLSWTDFLKQGFIKENLSTSAVENLTPGEMPCLVLSDLDKLDILGIISKGTASEIVIRLLSRFLRQYNRSLSDKNANFLSHHFYSFLHSPDANDELSKKYLPDFDLRDEINLPLDNLRKIYRMGGILTLLDLGGYIRTVRESKGLSFRKTAANLNITFPALVNFERKLSPRVKLQDVIDIDNALDAQGEFVLLAWRVAEFYLGIYRVKPGDAPKIKDWQQHEIHFIEKLITASRLFQYHFPEDRSWLDWYREESLNGFENIIR